MNLLQRSTIIRLTALYCLFFLIALGLGYPVLNRYDPRQTAGLSDVKSYAAMVTGAPAPGLMHLRFRVLVPWVAKPFYLAAKGRSGSWDPVMLGLLTADSVFVAGAAWLIVILGTLLFSNYSVALIASLLYLLNFAVPNLRLAGLVDAGEGFFFLALFWSLLKQKFRLLPLVSILGALTKESFVPFALVFMALWWFVVRGQLPSRRALGAICLSWLAGLGALSCLQRSVLGYWVTPIEFAGTLHGNHGYLSHFASSLWDRNLLYTFVWLLPLALPQLKRLPQSWLIPTGGAVATVFVLDAFYGGAPGTVPRALFSVAGPLLVLSSASFINGWTSTPDF